MKSGIVDKENKIREGVSSMALFIWLYLAILTAYFFIQSLVNQKRIREKEEEIFARFEIQENRIASDYKTLVHKLQEIESL